MPRGPNRGPRSRTLSILFLKDDVARPRDALHAPGDLAEHVVRAENDVIGTAFVKPSVEHPPRWASFFNDQLPKKDLKTSQPSVVLIVKVGGRLCAVTFGPGRWLLKPGCWDENFGRRVTLNSIDPASIRTIDTKRFDSLARHTREQASRVGRIAGFAIDVDQDLLRSVTGTPEDKSLGTRMTGMDSLTVTVPVDLAGLPALLKRYIAKSKEDGYKAEFGFIDHLGEERDPTIVGELDSTLCSLLTKKKRDRIWMAAPDILDWTNIDHFTIGGLSGPTYDDPSVTGLLDYFGSDPVTLAVLKRRRVHAISADGSGEVNAWPIYKCIYAEIEREDSTFLLSDGKWYRVQSAFVREVDQAIGRIAKNRVPLPPYDDSDEGKYLERICADDGALTLMDRKLVAIGGGASKIEVCDVLTDRKQLVHVKRYGHAAAMSHLFAQGVISAECLADPDFRAAANRKLPGKRALPGSNGKFRSGDFEVVFAIVSKGAEIFPRLPFFSRLNLRTAHRHLGALGYRVSLTKIQSVRV